MDSLRGQLLVARNQLQDPNFHRTVVLLLEHNEDGAFGVVLNRPLEVEVDDVLPGWGDVVDQPRRVFQGGPVGLDGAIGVSAGGPTLAVMAAPFGLVDLDSDPALLVGAFTGLRIFAGHSGWGGGQLEAEIDEGSWFVVPAEPADAACAEPDQLWRQVLRRQGGNLAIVANFPEDARLN
ncbi:MAG TPA: YqgE/AlgH family protein [Cellulomonas sp.]|nr:YqgE/AlgH family protein [Cellulomonas sp.]